MIYKRTLAQTYWLMVVGTRPRNDSSNVPTGKKVVSPDKNKGCPTLIYLFLSYIKSGWLAPLFIFIIVGFLSGCSALFVCEALSNIRGNEKFQVKRRVLYLTMKAVSHCL